MGQYVLEIGSSSLEELRQIVEFNLLGPSGLQVLPWVDRESMTYSSSDLSVSSVMEGLNGRSLASAIWRDVKAGVRYVLIYCPNFAASGLGLWMCTVEYTDETWGTLWGELGSHPSFRFACVSLEEGVLLSDGQLSPDNFPWSDPSLLAAAVRSETGEWVSREVALSSPGVAS
jgi:hypothetical protein